MLEKIKIDDDLQKKAAVRLKIDHITYQNEACERPTIYFEIRDTENNRLGFCDLRLFSDETTEIDGNIGYTVFKPYRGRGIGAKACRIMSELAREKGMRALLITCERENIASGKTAKNAGFEFIGERKIPPEHAAYSRGKRWVDVYEIILGD